MRPYFGIGYIRGRGTFQGPILRDHVPAAGTKSLQATQENARTTKPTTLSQGLAFRMLRSAFRGVGFWAL